jgi:hypothetical protein
LKNQPANSRAGLHPARIRAIIIGIVLLSFSGLRRSDSQKSLRRSALLFEDQWRYLSVEALGRHQFDKRESLFGGAPSARLKFS